MAKAIKLFVGNDTYGRSVERAKRFDGVWFSRYSEYNGYGVGFCKWYQDEPSYITKSERQIANGVFETFQHEPIVAWGWNKMIELDAPFRIRLPKV